MTTVALIQLGLALLPTVTTGVTQFVAWINTLRTAAAQSSEWTPELEANYRATLLRHDLTPEELPDPR